MHTREVSNAGSSNLKWLTIPIVELDGGPESFGLEQILKRTYSVHPVLFSGHQMNGKDLSEHAQSQ
jgi:hypothetical protein